MTIPFNKPFMTGRELWHIAQTDTNGHLSGDAQFTKKYRAWLEQSTGTKRALLTHSCTTPFEAAGKLRRPVLPEGCAHNAHMSYILLDSLEQRVVTALNEAL